MSWEIAQLCMQRGWDIFPVRDKRPLIKWKEGACRTWEAWPEGADVGLPTGARNGLVVIDDDRQKFGLESWYCPVATYAVRTRSGGVHHYFEHPGGTIRNSAGRVAEHVDVRGDGGYVVAYSVSDSPLATLPEGLIPTQMSKTSLAVRLDPGQRSAYQHALLQLPPWPQGERNLALFKAACVFLENDMELRVLFEKALQSGLTQEEAERTLASARARVVN